MAKSAKGTSMKDIAEVCGFSISTVSKVLNGSSEISEETAAKIRRDAELLGYYKGGGSEDRPDKPSGVVGITFDRTAARESRELYTDIARAYRRKMEENENDLIILRNYHSEHEKSLLARSAQMRLSGLTLVGRRYLSDDSIDYSNFQRLGIALVTVGYYRSGIAGVVSDRYEGMLRLLSLAERLGHTHISVICAGESNHPFGETEAVFRKAYYSLFEREYTDHLFYCDREDPERLFEILYHLGEQKTKPTCIICDGDWLAVHAYDYINSARGGLLRGLSVLCFEGERRNEAVQCHMAGTYINGSAMGEKAASMILQALHHRERYIPEFVKITPILLVEDSIRDLSDVSAKKPLKGKISGLKRYMGYEEAVRTHIDER